MTMASTLTTAPAAALTQLKALFLPGTGWAEIRTFTRKTEQGDRLYEGEQFWIDTSDIDGGVAALPDLAAIPNGEIYVGANPRSDRVGTKESVKILTACYTDIDKVDDPHDALKRAMSRPLPPNFAVHSGGGLHLYWLIKPTELKDAWLAAQRGILEAFRPMGADPKVAGDESRVLRLAPFPNRKRGEVRPTSVLLNNSAIRYTLDRVMAAYPYHQVQTRTNQMAANADQFAGVLGHKTLQFIRYGAAEGARNSGLFNAACDMAGNNVPEGNALATLTPSAVASGLAPREVEAAVRSAYSKPREPVVKVPAGLKTESAVAQTATSQARSDVPMPRVVDMPLRSTTDTDSLANHFLSMRPTIVAYEAQLYEYDGNRNHYAACRPDKIRADIQAIFERNFAEYSSHRIEEVLKAVYNKRLEDGLPPVWRRDTKNAVGDARAMIAFRNGLLDVAASKHGKYVTIPATPDLFTLSALPHDFSAEATCKQWLAFLHSVFQGDTECVALLQEWFGYCLTSDTSMQKYLLLIGPPGSGKSTVLRILEAVVGCDNCAHPSLGDLASEFGLWPLVGKLLAIIPDAHLGRSRDSTRMSEVLKSITGQDRLNVNRKYLPPLIGVRLNTRIAMAMNEIPEFADHANTHTRRQLILPMTKSFAANPDTGLEDRLLAEVPGIVCWALQGLWRLREQKRFSHCRASENAIRDFEELTSPLKAFVNEKCTLASGERIYSEVLFATWKSWCLTSGHESGSVNSFGMRLRTLCPAIVRQRESAGERKYVYHNVGLK